MAEGLARIINLEHPESASPDELFFITVTFRNDGDGDTMVIKMEDMDTGELLWDQAGFIFAGAEWVTSRGFNMPSRDLRLKFNVGHVEDGMDIIDDTREFTMIATGVLLQGNAVISRITINGIEVFPIANDVSVPIGGAVNMNVSITNTGADDDIFVSFVTVPDLDMPTLRAPSFGAGETWATGVNFDMPEQDILITVNAGHVE